MNPASLIHTFINKNKSQVSYLAVKWTKEKSVYLSVQNERPENIQTDFDQGFRVEVLINGHFGYAGTSQLDLDGLQRSFEKAKESTEFFSSKKIFPFDYKARSYSKTTYRSQIQEPLDKLSLTDIQSNLIFYTQLMKKDNRIFYRGAHSTVLDVSEIKIDSLGSETEQIFSVVNLDLIVRAQGPYDIQTRSQNLCLQIGAEAFLKSRLGPIAEQISTEVLALCDAENCPKEKLDLLISPDQMGLQIHETVGHPLEVDRILGDERNYAGWSFVQRQDFGHLQFGSSKMNILFEPDRFAELASYSIDDSGLRAEKKYLIKEGKLILGLGGLESSLRSDLSPVANARSSSWNRPPIDRMANLNLEPGQTTLKDLISKVENGLWVSTNRSWSIDDYRRKFQFGCEYGILIKEGQLGKVVRNPNYHGISVPFWNQLKDVSSESGIYGSFYCGKGEPNQIIRVGHASPYSLFSNVEVF